MISQIANRYAQAVYDLSTEQKKVEQVYVDLVALSKFFADSPHVLKLLKSPVFLSSPKWKTIRELFHKNLSPATYSFILFLAHKGRLGLLDEVCRAFINLHRANLGIIEAKITSSHPMLKQQTASIRDRLAEVLKKEIEANVIIDKKMLGGIKVQVSDKVYDFSLRTQLNKFKENVISA